MEHNNKQLCAHLGHLCVAPYPLAYREHAVKSCIWMVKTPRKPRQISCEEPIPVAALYKAWVWGRSLAGIAGLNPIGEMDVCICECCVLSCRDLCDGPTLRPRVSYRVCVCVCVFLQLSVISKPQHRGCLG